MGHQQPPIAFRNLYQFDSTLNCFWSTYILLFVDKKNPLVDFTFNKSNGSLRLDVGDIDIFFNRTKPWTQLMHGKSPWRGGWEKCHVPLQILIEVLTKSEAMMLDVYAFAWDIYIYTYTHIYIDVYIYIYIINSKC